MSIKLFNDDCLQVMRDIESGSIDAIITDPPYGTTACKWDSVIPFEPMWTELKRIIKPNGAIVLFGSQPFTSALIMSNANGFAFSLVWDKFFSGNFVQAERQQLKTHEDIIVFSKNGKQPRYYPQMEDRDTPIRKGGNKQSKAIPIAITKKSINFGNPVYKKKFPTSQLRFSSRNGRGLHPTQKPLALLEYLIKTYTNEGETVLDFTMGSGTTGHAAVNLNRHFIGCELNKDYYDIASKRIESAQNELINQFGAIA